MRGPRWARSLLTVILLLTTVVEVLGEIEIRATTPPETTTGAKYIGGHAPAILPSTKNLPIQRNVTVQSGALSEGRKAKYARRRYYLVEGHVRSNYVYGEIEFLNKREVRGYLYRINNKDTRLYIYGERVGRQTLDAYDKRGTYYALRIISP